jgi:glyoxylase-like metal-dependent hydrolase (beta-lactamase superfamily II)
MPPYTEAPETVAPGYEVQAFRTPTLPPASHTNSIAIGVRAVLLVEPATPYAEEQERFQHWVRDLERRGRRPLGLLLTHHHPDHAGGARALRQALSLPLWCHEETAARIDCPVDRTLSDGERLDLGDREVEVLHTPGHAPGHLCLWDAAAGVLVVADMVAEIGTILIDPSDGHMATYLRQLERLEALGASLLVPAHGAAIGDAAGCLGGTRRHRLAREAKILGAVQQAARPLGFTPLLDAAYDDKPAALRPLAERSLRAHLVKLLDEGKVVREADTTNSDAYRAA